MGSGLICFVVDLYLVLHPSPLPREESRPDECEETAPYTDHAEPGPYSPVTSPVPVTAIPCTDTATAIPTGTVLQTVPSAASRGPIWLPKRQLPRWSVPLFYDW